MVEAVNELFRSANEEHVAARTRSRRTGPRELAKDVTETLDRLRDNDASLAIFRLTELVGEVRRATLRSVHPHPVYLYHLYRCRSLFLSSNATLLLASAGGRTVTLRRTLRTGDELCRARAWPAPPPGHPRTPTWPRQSRLCERSELFPSTAAPLPPSSGQGATAACGLESSASASHDSCE